MFKAKQEINFNGQTYQAGDLIEKPSTRMIDLGLVEKVEGEVAKPAKKEKAEKVEKVEKVEEVQQTEVKDEILTEDSAEIEVQKTEE